MKRQLHILFFLAILAVVSACRQEIVYPVTCQVTLDAANTYFAGDPVRFLIKGNVDNLLFYSGEINHQYMYSTRYSVGHDEINSALLRVDYQPRYGYADGLSVYVSDSFPGLDGADFEKDRSTIRQMVLDGMPGWTELPYDEGASTVWTHQDYDISGYVDNFVLAFHWNPVLGSLAQRHYWISGDIFIDIKGAPASTLGFQGIDWVAIMLNDEYTQDPYTQRGNPGFDLSRPQTADIMVNGCNGAPSMGGAAGGVEYAHDGWLVTRPMTLTRVAHDEGVVIKNLQNYLDSYEYVFEEPGTYTVTFVAVNRNVDGRSKVIRELEINIFPKD
ncbi:MAG: DUF5017 domain-containing protein [Bacteroidales bacterium]|nr:DUF5017 domain-containing protein [Bacteroidales bacterium]